MNKAKLIDLTVPSFFLFFSIWIIATAGAMGEEEKTFPLMIGCFQLTVALCQLWKDLLKTDHSERFSNSNTFKVIEALVVMALYVFLIEKIGYFLDTVLIVTYIALTLGYRHWKSVFLISFSITAATFIVFKVLLKVPR